MKHSRKMVLISEDEYTQLKAKIKENDTQPRQVQENDTRSGYVVENVMQPNAASEIGTQTETMVTHYPVQSQCNLKKGTEKIPAEKKITKTSPSSKKLTKNGPSKRYLTQSGLGEEKPRPQGPPGVPLRKQEKKFSEGLPPGWVIF